MVVHCQNDKRLIIIHNAGGISAAGLFNNNFLAYKMKKSQKHVWNVELWSKKAYRNNFEYSCKEDMDIIGLYENLEDALNLYANASKDCQKRIAIFEGLYDKKSGDFEFVSHFFPYYLNQERGRKTVK